MYQGRASPYAIRVKLAKDIQSAKYATCKAPHVCPLPPAHIVREGEKGVRGQLGDVYIIFGLERTVGSHGIKDNDAKG